MSNIWSRLINLAGNITGTLPVANGGTGLTAGTSGGVLAYTASGTLASSAALTAHGVVIGGGAGVAPTVTAAGTTGQILAGASTDPTWLSVGQAWSASTGAAATRSGTNGSTYSVRATTTPAAMGIVVSATLDIGTYLVSGSVGGNPTSATGSYSVQLWVGGTSVTTANLFTIEAWPSGQTFSITVPSIPVVITSNSTIVGLAESFTGTTASNNKQELWITKIAN